VIIRLLVFFGLLFGILIVAIAANRVTLSDNGSYLLAFGMIIVMACLIISVVLVIKSS